MKGNGHLPEPVPQRALLHSGAAISVVASGAAFATVSIFVSVSRLALRRDSGKGSVDLVSQRLPLFLRVLQDGEHTLVAIHALFHLEQLRLGDEGVDLKIPSVSITPH